MTYIAIIPNRLYEGVNQFQLLAIPFFLLAADIMINADISGKLFRFVKLFVGRFRGGLAYVNVIVSMVFGSVSGTALGDIAALGKVEMDAMDEEGYDKDFSCALTAASSLQSPLSRQVILQYYMPASWDFLLEHYFLLGFYQELCSEWHKFYTLLQ